MTLPTSTRAPHPLHLNKSWKLFPTQFMNEWHGQPALMPACPPQYLPQQQLPNCLPTSSAGTTTQPQTRLRNACYNLALLRTHSQDPAARWERQLLLWCCTKCDYIQKGGGIANLILARTLQLYTPPYALSPHHSHELGTHTTGTLSGQLHDLEWCAASLAFVRHPGQTLSEPGPVVPLASAGPPPKKGAPPLPARVLLRPHLSRTIFGSEHRSHAVEPTTARSGDMMALPLPPEARPLVQVVHANLCEYLTCTAATEPTSVWAGNQHSAPRPTGSR